VLYRDFSTQEELDAQYNLREAVPEFPHYKEFYEEHRAARPASGSSAASTSHMGRPWPSTWTSSPPGSLRLQSWSFSTVGTGTPLAARTLASLLRVRSPQGLLPS
jgi:hypothetical protein